MFTVIFVAVFSQPVNAARIFRGFIPADSQVKSSLPEVSAKTAKEKIRILRESKIQFKNFDTIESSNRSGFFKLPADDNSFVIATNLSIYANISKKKLTAWVMGRGQTGLLTQPQLQLYDCNFDFVQRLVPDQQGFYLVSLSKFNRCRNQAKSFYLVASGDSDFTFLSLEWSKGFENWKQPVQITKSERFRLEATDINTFLPTGVFYPGDEVYIHHTFKTKQTNPEALVFENQNQLNSFEVPLKRKAGAYLKTWFTVPLQTNAGVYELFYREGKKLFATSNYLTVLSSKPEVTNISISRKHSEIVFLPTPLKYQFNFDRDQMKKLKVLASVKIMSAAAFVFPKDPLIADYKYYFDPLGSQLLGSELCGGKIKSYDFQSLEKEFKSGETIEIPPPTVDACSGPTNLLVNLEVWEGQKLAKRYEERIAYLPSDELIVSKIKRTDAAVAIDATVYDYLQKKVLNRRVELESFVNEQQINRNRLIGGNFSTTVLDNLKSNKEFCRRSDEKLNSWVCPLAQAVGQKQLVFKFNSFSSKNENLAAIFALASKQNEFAVNNRSNRSIAMRLKKQVLVGEKAQLLISTPYKKSDVILILENDKFEKKFFYTIDSDNPEIEFEVKSEFSPKYFATAIVKPSLQEAHGGFEDTKFAVSQFFAFGSDAIDVNFNYSENTFELNKKNSLELTASKSSHESIDKVLVFAISEARFLFNEAQNSLAQAYSLARIPYTSQMVSTFTMNQAGQDSSPRQVMLNEPYAMPWSRISMLNGSRYLWGWNENLKFDENGKTHFIFEIPAAEFRGEYVYVVAKVFLKDGREISKFTRLKLIKSENNLALNLVSNPISENKLKSVAAKNNVQDKTFTDWPFKSIETETSNVDFLQIRNSFKPSHKIILDRNDRIIGLYRNDFNKTHLSWISLKSVKDDFTKLLMLSEDKGFMNHSGVDWMALAKASMEYLKNISETKRGGASTLSMQLTNLLSPDLKGKRKQVSDKYTQIKRTLELEKTWSKSEILEAYLNLVPLRGDLVGLSAGSLFLFRKHPSQLTEFESALIIAMIPSPNAKKDVLVQRGCRLIAATLCEEFKVFVEATLEKFEKNKSELQILGIPPESILIAKEGDQLRTAIDLDLQNRIRSILRSHIERFKRENLNEAAAVVINNKTSEVISYVPNVGEGISRNYFIDHAQLLRQPGSTLKPFIYAMAFDKDLVNLNSIISDSPVNEIQANSEIYSPLNFDLKYRGPVAIGEALATSLNVPAVKVMQLLNEKEVKQKLKSLGISTIDLNRNYGSSLVLGAADVSLFELSRAYSQLFYGKAFKKPTVAQLKLILSQPIYKRSYPDQNVLTDTLYPYVVKTGTSNYSKDIWCFAVNDKYTIGLWVGNSNFDPPWNIGNFNGALLMQNLLMGIEEFQIQSLALDYSVSQLKPIKIAEASQSKKLISYPLENAVIKWDPNLTPDIQLVRIIVAKQQDETYYVQVNGEEAQQLTPTFSILPRNGKNEIQLLDSNKVKLETVHFYYLQ